MGDKVSVIVPVFNAGDNLARCVESLIRQTHRALEIIIVDDGSTDSSQEIIKAFASEDDRIRPILQANQGVSAARNAGIDAATGDFISFVDADDWLEAEAYAILAGLFLSSDVEFITFGYSVDHGVSSHVPEFPDHYVGTYGGHMGVGAVLATRNRFAWTRIFKRELIGDTRFRRDLHWGEDTVFVVEVAKRAAASTTLREPFYHYVQSPDSATRSHFNPKRWTGLQMTRVLEHLVRDGHVEFMDDVLRTRVNIVGSLFLDAYASGDVPRESIRALKRTIRSDIGPVVKSQRILLPTKLKASLMVVSPRLFVAQRRVVNVLRALRERSAAGDGGAFAGAEMR